MSPVARAGAAAELDRSVVIVGTRTTSGFFRRWRRHRAFGQNLGLHGRIVWQFLWTKVRP
jgi:hypothetical protein